MCDIILKVVECILYYLFLLGFPDYQAVNIGF
jgi:hypothetical protein